MPRDLRCFGDLMEAIRANRLREVKSIFENKIKRRDKLQYLCVGECDSKSSKDRECESAILAATKLEDGAILKYFIEHGADVNFMCETSSGKRTSPLHVAITNGLYTNVNLLLEANADVNKTDHFNRTPLHIAVKMTDIEAVRMLLSRGAKVNICDRDGFLPLQMATKYGHMELVRVLLDHHAEVFQRGQVGPSPLHIAALEGHVNIADILACRVDVNIKVDCVRFGKQKTALHLAAERGYVEVAQLLVNKFGADVNCQDNDDCSPLHAVVSVRYDCRRMRKREDFDLVAELLIRNGSQIDLQCNTGNTPLHLAAKNHYHRVVELLLSAGADTTIQNNENKVAKDIIPEYDLQMKQLFHRVAKGTIIVNKMAGDTTVYPFPQPLSPIIAPKQCIGTPIIGSPTFNNMGRSIDNFGRSSHENKGFSYVNVTRSDDLSGNPNSHVTQLQGPNVFNKFPLNPTAPTLVNGSNL